MNPVASRTAYEYYLFPAMPLNSQSVSLPPQITRAVEVAVEEWTGADQVQRLWSRDPSLWTGSDEDQWLGWLDLVATQLEKRRTFSKISADVRQGQFTYVLLLGMGGSSLCPEVLRSTFERGQSYPALRVLDSTDPAQVRAAENEIDLRRTLFIFSSKSGTTLETSILFEYFFDRVARVCSPVETGRRFVAITDPGSALESLAHQRNFRRVFLGRPDVGGRFSALSDFGLVPAALMGLDVERFLYSTKEMVDQCGAAVPVPKNPGVLLGIVLGQLAVSDRNKLTIAASPAIASLGAWLEQLVAESTGKDGKGIVPVDQETLGPPEVYGDDRVFVYLKLSTEGSTSDDSAIDRIEQAGQPVVRIVLGDSYALGQEFFRWEMATAVAGSLLNLNPFDQPDVDASKVASIQLTAEFDQTGALKEAEPFFETAEISLFSDSNAVARVLQEVPPKPSLSGYLNEYLSGLNTGDYFAILAYVEMNTMHRFHLQSIRDIVRDRTRVATCLGFGPRFLHSTGQLHKGGPATGLFLQITRDDPLDLPVPGRSYSFGIVKAAQALGDMKVLEQRGRRVLRAHIRGDLTHGLAQLQQAVAEALDR
jgi:transaldolase/glucose-6-phosphate isomerase